MKIRRANRGSLRALCLLSSFASPSRRRRANVAACLGGQGHFFECASYCFEGGLSRDRHSRPAAAHSNQGSNPVHPREKMPKSRSQIPTPVPRAEVPSTKIRQRRIKGRKPAERGKTTGVELTGGASQSKNRRAKNGRPESKRKRSETAQPQILTNSHLSFRIFGCPGTRERRNPLPVLHHE